jgi:lipopolysaccharide/colanic/teichoic acid biosynthesis glycosyltransferase
MLVRDAGEHAVTSPVSDRFNEHSALGVGRPAPRVRHIAALALATGDALAIVAASWLALALTALEYRLLLDRSYPLLHEPGRIADRMLEVAAAAAVFVIWMTARQRYHQRTPAWTEGREIISTAVAVAMFDAVLQYATKDDLSRLWFAQGWLVSVPMLLIARQATRKLLAMLGVWTRRVLVVGRAGHVADIVEALNDDDSMGYDVVACHEIDSPAVESVLSGIAPRQPVEIVYDCLPVSTAITSRIHEEIALLDASDVAAWRVRLAERGLHPAGYEVNIEALAPQGAAADMDVPAAFAVAPTLDQAITDAFAEICACFPRLASCRLTTGDGESAGSVDMATLRGLCVTHRIEMLVLALDSDQPLRTDRIVRELVRAELPFALVPPVRGVPVLGLQAHHFFPHDVVLLQPQNNLDRPFNQMLKRAMDIVGAVLGLALLAPLLLMLALAVKLDGGPAFFAHERIGRGGRRFRCLKFRTMVPDAAAILDEHLRTHPQAREEWERDFKLRNDPRITTLGSFLRKSSLDELPQLLNVLRGEMSFVGPRPVVEKELAYYGEDGDFYLRVRPGITGLWQVSGRNETTYAKRVALDAWYVRNWSPWHDVAIVFNTIPAVLRQRGVY